MSNFKQTLNELIKMKNLFTLIALIFTVSLSAQIGKAKENTKWVTIGVSDKLVGTPKLSKVANGNLYDLYYSNFEYRNIDDMKHLFFEATPEELDYLYNEFASVFQSKSKDTKNIQVGNATVYYKRVAASIRISIDYEDISGETSGWFFVSKKKLAKLFGKS